jgi:hypothetical protein
MKKLVPSSFTQLLNQLKEIITENIENNVWKPTFLRDRNREKSMSSGP